MTNRTVKAGLIDALAQEIRRVDGNHSLGAGQLAEALMPFISTLPDAGVSEELEQAKALVAEANNSLFGSQSYFHSLTGGPFDKHHLSRAIEDLKDRARRVDRAEAALSSQHAEAAPVAEDLRAEVLRLFKANNMESDERLAIITAEYFATRSPVPADAGQPVAVERVECVSYDTGYEMPADPIWRIEIDGYCADFEFETAARNFAAAINNRSTLIPTTSPAKGGADGPVPAHECEFSIGQPVRLAHPYPEMDPDTVFYITGISWEHRMVPAHGWNIEVATKEDIQKGYGQTDGYRPVDLSALRTSAPAGRQAKEGEVNG